MCWSAPASLVAFIVGWSLSILLIIRNKPFDRVWGIFFLFVTLMQLFEFLIWVDQPREGDTTCKNGKYKGNLNNVVSHISVIQNLIQPLVVLVLALILIPPDKLFLNHKIIAALSLVYLVSLIVWMCKSNVFKTRLCTVPCTECDYRYLQWQWTEPKWSGKYIWIMYFAFIIISLGAMSKTRGGLYLAIFILVIGIVTASFYPFKKAWGSWWCVAAVLGPLLKVFIPTDKLWQKTF